jgi:biopolymer transport protein ExbB
MFQTQLRNRRWLGMLSAVFIFAITCVGEQAATAQSTDPPADAPAAAIAPAVDSATPGAPAAPVQKSKLRWFFESSGWIGAVIFLLSVYFVATVIRLFNELRMPVAMPPEVVAQCDALLAKRDYQGVYDLAKSVETPYTRLLSAGLAEISSGLDAARSAMDCVAECITVGMEKQISMLAVLGTLGPMIGLLGTLKGMIASFSVIALSDTQLKASEVAGGISEALLLTFEGVALSVPAIFLYAVFRNRVSQISAEVFLEADEFMRRVATSAKSKQAA